MAEMLIDGAKLDACNTAEADAIRAKTGGSSPIPYDYANNKGFADAIAAIPSGGVDTGVEFIEYNANGEVIEANFYGTPGRRFFVYWWYNNSNTVLLHLVDRPMHIGYQAFQNAFIEFDVSTLSDVVTADEGAFAIYPNAQNSLAEKTLSLPNFTGGGSGGSRFRSTSQYFYGGFFLPKMQTVRDFEWYQYKVPNVSVQIGSVGYPVTQCGQRPFGGSTGSGTITVYTTGVLLDTIKAAIQNQAGASYTWIYKAAEATEYDGVSYAAGDTMLTVGGA